MAKIENPILVSLYSHIVEQTLSETNSVEEANQKLRDLGKELGFQLYMSTDIESKTKETVTTREDVAKLIDVVFRALYDKRASEIDMDTARGSVRVSDKNCIWCQDVNLEGMRGFGYCEIFSGILQAILEFKGVQANVFQEMSRATGADMCTWNVRLA